jgi:Uma2 family endonuclease
MNVPVLATRWPKERFTVAQIWALVEMGLLHEGRGFELVDGEVRLVSPKGPLHEDVSRHVMRWLRKLPASLDALPETTLYFDDANFREPDYVVFDSGLATADLQPRDVLLAIEVAHDSWAYDTDDKAAYYAAHGVNEYWVIHALKRMIRVHRSGGAEGWAEVRDIPAGGAIAPLCAPDAPFSLEPGNG